MKRILLIATGGTIASATSEQGLFPAFDAQHLLERLPEPCHNCSIESISIMSVDSTNMTPDRMVQIASAIYDNYDSFDGFVVTHGTDTMAYTSNALTYMLQNIQKPVALTGSMVAIEAMYTDAKQNISDAIRFAEEGLPGVFVVFDGRVIIGTRAIKEKSSSTDAFRSVNFPRIANIKFGEIIYNEALSYGDYRQRIAGDASQPLFLNTAMCTDIFVLKLFPGISPDIFDYIRAHFKGVVIEGYGTGGIPNLLPDLTSRVGALVDAGLAVVITTQCMEEGVDLSIYEVGNRLLDKNVIIPGDMNTESIVIKLMFALGNYQNSNDIKSFMETPVFGDMN